MEVIRYLLDNGAPVNALHHQDQPKATAMYDQFGRGHQTALHVAARAGAVNMVSLLLELGANPGINDTMGGTVVEFARKTNNSRINALLDPTLKLGAEESGEVREGAGTGAERKRCRSGTEPAEAVRYVRSKREDKEWKWVYMSGESLTS